jgi:hypothetical protein
VRPAHETAVESADGARIPLASRQVVRVEPETTADSAVSVVSRFASRRFVHSAQETPSWPGPCARRQAEAPE